MDISTLTSAPHPDPKLSPPDQSRRAVYRHLVFRVRQSLQSAPCDPDTPEALAEREAAVIAIATSFNPQTYGEVLFATRIAIADAQQAALGDELAQCRGDRRWTSRLRAQAASFGRESRGALNALVKLQRERHQLSGEAAGIADAAGRAAQHAMSEALEGLPPPQPLPPPIAAEAFAAGAGGSWWGAAPDAVADAAPRITRPPAPLPPSMAADLAERPEPPDPPETAAAEAAAAAETADRFNAPPGYLPWQPGCTTPMWYTETHDNMTEEQRRLGRIWGEANEFCIICPQWAQLIRKHRGPPPDCDFELPSPDVLHVLLHDNSGNFRWADAWQPRPAEQPAVPQAAEA